jgi:uncharacterized damage-inducible protein DinB
MTAETERLSDQLRRSYHGPAWHGPSLSELLSGVDAAKATARPVHNAHSIREIVLHVAHWEHLALGALRGSPLPPEEENDWPESDARWPDALTDLQTATDELATAIGSFPVSKLEDTVPGRKHSFAFLLHGVVQHNLYHAGQIALLKKS